MNKSFKVVFSKARGALMAVNEATSSVQAKGTKMVVAAAAIAAVFPLAAQAAAFNISESSQEQTGEYGGVQGVTGDNYITVADGLKFTKNHANASGGVFSVSSTTENAKTTIGDNVTFEGNSSAAQGGALHLQRAEGTTIGDNVKFIGNQSGSYAGGAIYQESYTDSSKNEYESSLAIGENAYFEGNKSTTSHGGAIFNFGAGTESKMELGDGAQFVKNEAIKSGGAISNWGATFNLGNNASFSENTSGTYGGAIYNAGYEYVNNRDAVMTIGSGAKFENNTAVSSGGAIYNAAGGDITFEAGTAESHAYFSGNKVSAANSSAQGGAVMNLGKIGFDDYAFFEGNSAYIGGAVANNGTGAEATFGDNVTFQYNTALWAGAIFNTKGTLIIGDNVQFIGNTSTGDASSGTAYAYGDGGMGGAIQSQASSNATSSLVIGENAYFADNVAENSSGGAIANFRHYQTSVGGTVDVSTEVAKVVATIGDGAQFINNSAAVSGGAIFNNGTLNFEGSATFSGNTASNVLNDIHNDGIVNVKGGTLSLDGGITGSGTISFADGSALNVIVRDAQETSTTITNHVTLDGTVSLSMTFAPGYEGEYQLITEDGSLEGTFELVENSLFDVTANEENNGTFTIQLKDSGELAESIGADSNQAAAIDAMMSAEGGSEAYAAVVESISSDLQSNDAGRKQAALDAVTAMSPETAPMVAQIQTDTAAQVFSVIGTRLGGSQGAASGDGTSGTALWVQGMVGTTDMEKTGSTHGYSADTTGLALGLEAKPTQSTTVGMGFAYASTDVDGFLRSTDVDNMTAFLYGEYKPADWYVNGILSYAWANYDEDRSVAGTAVTAKYDADTFGVQVMGGINLDAAGITAAPEIGLRYAHIGTDGYTDSLGISVADSDEDVLTGVAGVRLAKAFEVSPAMSVQPEVRLAVTYDFVDADNRSFVTLANGSSYTVDGETLDRFAFEAGIGVKAEMGDNFELALSYEGAWRSDFQNHAGLVNAKYKF